jgi:hypothetical protein
LGRPVSISGWQGCCWSTGSRVEGGRGGCRRRAEAAAELRREYSSGGRKERQYDAVECVKEVERDSWVSFKAKRSTVQVEQLLASSTAHVAARAMAVRRGGAGRGPTRGGDRQARCWSGTWREERRRGAAGAQAHGQRRRRGWRGEKQREEDWR